ncbi:MAG: hypothetical protein Q9210_006808 [Variospora velana]
MTLPEALAFHDVAYSEAEVEFRTDIGPVTPSSEKASLVSVHTLVNAIEATLTEQNASVVRTPTVRIPWLDAPGREIWAKLELQQHSGSFKYRGALNAMRSSEHSVVVTASAGNHALATVEAGEKLGKVVEIFAPTTASTIKVERLTRLAHVTLVGRDLYEATLAAKEHVRLNGGLGPPATQYLSPYADFDVVAGAGTVMPEAMADAGDFDSVIVPLGGGGLAAAVGAYCSVRSPATRVVCTHPEIFGRDFASGSPISRQLRRSTEASLSDGLAVQLVEQTPFAGILDRTIREVVQVSETLTAASIAYLIRLQSLMVEGAAATTVAALLQDPEARKFSGKVLLLLTGGNVSSSAVAKALVAGIADSPTRQKLGLRHVVDPLERNGAVRASRIQGHHQPSPKLDYWQIWQTLGDELQKSLSHTWAKYTRMNTFARKSFLDQDGWISDVFEATYRLAEVFSVDIQTPGLLTTWKTEHRYRVLIQLHATLASMLEKASAAYNQSGREWFFDTSTQNTNAVNYDRYGAQMIRTRELKLLQSLRLSHGEQVELLLTSSGMAAYQTIQLYLLQLLKAGDSVVISPYIYFEALEQLQAFPHLRVTHAKDFEAENIIAEAEHQNARAIFLDPVANIVDLPVTDIRKFLQAVSSRPGWENRIVVIDGTMVSGGMQVYDWLQGPHKLTLLYYESGSKYLQLGLDIQMSGLVVFPSQLDQAMRTVRRNSGTILYAKSLLQMPPITYDVFQSRNTMLSENANFLRCYLQECLPDAAEVRHPAEWQAFAWRHGGCLITIRFHSKGLNNKESLEACIELVLRTAEEHEVPITKGVSFGFSTARISAASSMANDSNPFLRVSVGVEANEVRVLAVVIEASILKYLAIYNV